MVQADLSYTSVPYRDELVTYFAPTTRHPQLQLSLNSAPFVSLRHDICADCQTKREGKRGRGNVTN